MYVLYVVYVLSTARCAGAATGVLRGAAAALLRQKWRGAATSRPVRPVLACSRGFTPMIPISPMIPMIASAFDTLAGT